MNEVSKVGGSGQTEEGFALEKALSDGWQVMLAQFVPLFLVMLTVGCLSLAVMLPYIIGVVLTIVLKSDMPQWIAGVAPFITMAAGFVFGPFIQMGMMKASLKALNGERPSVSDIFSVWPAYWQFLVANWMFGMMTGTGYWLFIFPGVWLNLTFHFFGYLILDRGVGPIESFRASEKLTKGNLIRLFVAEIIFLVVQAVGGLVFLIGAIPAGMVVAVAKASIYKQLLERSLASGQAAVAGSADDLDFDKLLNDARAQKSEAKDIDAP